MRRALLVTLLLLLPAVGTALAATTATVEISNANANETHFMKAFDAPAMALGDFDGDGKAEIVAHNDNQYVYVLSSTQARVLAEYRTDHPSGWGVRPINDPAVADVDNDGRLDIVAVNSAGVVCVHEYAGGTSTTSMTFERRWCKRMSTFDGETTGADAGAWVEDVDGDGRKEIFSQTEKIGQFAFNHDGSTRWAKNGYGGNSGPLVTDLEGDGRKEALFFGDGGEVYARDASTGSQKWVFWAGNHVRPASIPVAGNAADLDGDGRREVVFAARHAPADDTYYYDNHMMVFVLNHNGALKAKWQPSWAHPLSYTHPILHDLDGDGKRDILLQDWNTIGHKPGNWEQLGPAHVAAWTGTGQQLWMTTLDNTWSNDDLGLADVDGDGALEVIAVGMGSGGMDGVWYLDARTGAKEAHVGVGHDWTVLRGPVLGDLDGSGRLGWAISIHDSDWGGAIKVFQTDAACSATGFLGWQNNHRCGGGTGTPPPDPTPPPGDFTASFSTDGGNEWWISVRVDANRDLAGVDTRINGGSWKPLSLKSWGAWAASYHAPSGSVVEFRARSTDGAQVVSGAYSWPSGTPTSGGGTTPPPPSDGSFDATFTGVKGNEWWVQASVSASGGTLAKVDVSLNGGAWKPLENKGWGWAASYSIPSGTIVQLRATSTTGATDLSGCYKWTTATAATCPDGSATPPPPAGSTFAATFSNVKGNEWWIQTDVSVSGGTLAGVDARVDGGAWVALTKQSWGSWAKSVHAPAGSSVELRARSTDGQSVVSAAYAWPPG